MDLFKESGALFSSDRRYRYRLWRIWDESKPLIMFIGLNPSTADEYKLDPTVTRVKKFASAWNYGGFYMMNLYAFVSPYPSDLDVKNDPVGENDFHLMEVSRICKDIVFAWGAFKEAQERAKIVADLFPNAKALHINKDGSPKHPLYCSGSTQLIQFKKY